MNKGKRTGITMNKKLGSTLIAMTIIIFMLFLTLGMFTKNFGGSAKAEVASAKTSIQGINLSDGSDNVEEGDSGTYTFAVSNTKDGNVSEVSMQYNLSVVTESEDGDVKVDYELIPAIHDETNNTYTEDTSKESIKGKEDTTDNNKTNFAVTKDIPMQLMINSNKEPQVDYYILKFTPNGEGKFKFKVKVTSQQID